MLELRNSHFRIVVWLNTVWIKPSSLKLGVSAQKRLRSFIAFIRFL